jgi:hypothetical protein
MKSLLLVAAMALAGCTERQVVQASPPVAQAPSGRIEMRDTTTLHNANAGDATRIWIVMKDGDGHARVVLCDEAFLTLPAVDPSRLCVYWPPVPSGPVRK